VARNTVRNNDGAGLNLGAQSAYRENVITASFGQTVIGASAVNAGGNVCNGSLACP
jgi:hypothetical protein